MRALEETLRQMVANVAAEPWVVLSKGAGPGAVLRRTTRPFHKG